MSSKSMKGTGPAVPHLASKPGGWQGEIWDLRNDSDGAFVKMETPGNGGTGVIAVQEWTAPLAANATYVLGATSATTTAKTVSTFTHASLPHARNLQVVCTVTGTGVSQQSFQFVSAGIILTVTPTVSTDGQVMMKINPVSSFPVPGLTSVGPTIQTRSAQTTVLVKDGQTIVIGGLINETDTNNIQKVPLLGDIPILGAFFRRQLKEKNRTELLVFVTPHVIKN